MNDSRMNELPVIKSLSKIPTKNVKQKKTEKLPSLRKVYHEVIIA